MTDWPKEMLERLARSVDYAPKVKGDPPTDEALEMGETFLDALTPADLDVILAKLRPGAMICEWSPIEEAKSKFEIVTRAGLNGLRAWKDGDCWKVHCTEIKLVDDLAPQYFLAGLTPPKGEKP